MQRFYEAVGEVARGLMGLADDLREAGLPEEAHRCDTMSQHLSRAIHDALATTQPMDPQAIDPDASDPE